MQKSVIVFRSDKKELDELLLQGWKVIHLCPFVVATGMACTQYSPILGILEKDAGFIGAIGGGGEKKS